MDLRTFPDGMSPFDRTQSRRGQIEKEVGLDLSSLSVDEKKLGHAEEKNCEQMFGHVAIPVGLAGPLMINMSSGETIQTYLPLATTEGALVASVNRGCKAMTSAKGATTTSTLIGTTRSICFKTNNTGIAWEKIDESNSEWKKIGEATSHHLKVLSFTIDTEDDYIFLTIACDTGDAMGMNMVTIAADAIAEYLVKKIEGLELITVAGNVDSDKKPSKRTLEKGRGIEANAEVYLSKEVIADVLKSTPEKMLKVAHAKLKTGSKLAGSLGENLHAANILVALYIATGQDAAHVVEGSLTHTDVKQEKDGLTVSVRVPALMLGTIGGGTTLPGQKAALDILLKENTSLAPRRQLAEIMAAAVLAGEISLLAAQSTNELASAHKKMGR